MTAARATATRCHHRRVTDQQTYADVGAAAWRWVLDQVRWDDGPWIPVSVPHEGGPPDDRDGMHSGIGGLAHVLAEIRESREWTDEEAALADGIAVRIRKGLPTQPLATYFDGVVSDLGVLGALGADGSDVAIARLGELAADDGWEQPYLVEPTYPPHTRINDVTLGTAGPLLGAVWARRYGCRRRGAGPPRCRHPPRRGRGRAHRHQLVVRPEALQREGPGRAR
jgi:hypothetical protein